MKPVVQTQETNNIKDSYKLNKDRYSCDISSVQYVNKCPINQETNTTKNIRDKLKL